MVSAKLVKSVGRGSTKTRSSRISGQVSPSTPPPLPATPAPTPATAAPQSSGSDDQCASTSPSVQDNTDFSGSDLIKGGLPGTHADARTCCEECLERSQCNAWTYAKDNGKCYLKTAASSSSSRSNRISGQISKQPIPTPAPFFPAPPRSSAVSAAPSAGPGAAVPGWTTPLYLFASDSDVALLPSTAFIPSASAAASYTQLFDGAVGYISPTATELADSPLFVFWSEARQDVDTHTRASAASGYSEGVLLGYISSSAWTGEAPGSVPIWMYWNSKKQDNVAAPLSSALDVNLLMPYSGWNQHRHQFAQSTVPLLSAIADGNV